MASITLDSVSRIFPGGHAGVRDVSLEIGNGELVVLVGPSGSGKSTLLRLIAGLEAPTSGRILIGGRDVTDVPPQARDLAMVFQSYALYPHKTVRENLAFGLRMRGRPRAEIDRRVAQVAGTLQIQPLLDRRPSQLSGGQRQRVALGRAIVREPRAFLFDEPLSNLDPALRIDTRTELALLHRRLGATMVYVTHDQEEAMKLGERLVILRDGRVEQAGSPMEIYRRPATLFAARFLGSPPMNVLSGRVADGGVISIDGTSFALEADAVGEFATGSAVAAGIRPQDVEIVSPGGGQAEAIVQVIEPAGSESHVHVVLDGRIPQRLVAVIGAERDLRAEQRVGLVFERQRIHVFAQEPVHSRS